MTSKRSGTAQLFQGSYDTTFAAYGLMDDGMTPYIPGVNCYECGRFVGRDGHIGVGYFEMSNEVAYVEGECGRCLRAA